MKKRLFLFTLLVTHIVLATAQMSTTSLVSYYPFNGNANDFQGYEGTFFNGIVHNATLTTDRFGNENSAYLFNGTNSYIDLGINAGINTINSDFTLAYWICPELSAKGTVISSYGSASASSKRFIAYTDSNYARIRFLSSGIWQQAGSATNFIQPGKWHHVVHVRKRNSLETFIDTTEIATLYNYSSYNLEPVVSSIINNPGTPAATTIIGAEMAGCDTCNYFRGKIDELEFYNRAFSKSEIITAWETSTRNDISIMQQNSYISIKGLTEKSSVTLYSISGQPALSAIVQPENQISLRTIPTGAYILHIQTKEKVITKKLIIK